LAWDRRVKQAAGIKLLLDLWREEVIKALGVLP
jgi:hypothetical protein